MMRTAHHEHYDEIYEPGNAVRIIAAFSLFILWMKMFDWLRLFEATSFYIKLVTAVFYDMSSFMLLFFTGMAMFGSSMYMLQLSSTSQIDTVIKAQIGHFFLDTLVNQYLISLGEFDFEGFQEHPQRYLCWVLFSFSTFFTQIVMLNMLIAIMANTYEYIVDRKAQFALDNKMSIMSDYYSVIHRTDEPQDEHNYLFIVTPMSSFSDEGKDWQCGFSYMKKNIDQKI